MNDEDILAECKLGLRITSDDEDINRMVMQKVNTVKSFMIGAGVTQEGIESDIALGIIVLGVTDLWEMESGKLKFSPAFYTLLTQIS